MSVAPYSQAAELAGSISFVIGDANVIGADGKLLPIVRGQEIRSGEMLATGGNGHIHLRMVDGAFISVRPQSQLRIEEYHYDPAVPGNNRIKFVLEKGVARSITGRAGEAARENYRLNTPLAAIGIRGTDFVVQSDVNVTRVTVQSGAVVMSPLNKDCIAGALGPCNSEAARVLTAAMHDAYLELRSRYEAPKLIPAEKALESPNIISPPRPEEPTASSDKQAKVSVGTNTHDIVREAAVNSIQTSVDAAPGTATPAPIQVVVNAPPSKFWWGRWSNFIARGEEANSVSAMTLEPGRKLVASNSVFGLFQESGGVLIPSAGVARFQLAESEAYVLTGPKSASAARISAANLTVDFNARSYDTSLTVNSAGNSPVRVASSGTVSTDGKFLNDPARTGVALSGALSGNAEQAGYLFQRNLEGGVSVVGATRWFR